jgi:chromosome segregation ATPase
MSRDDDPEDIPSIVPTRDDDDLAAAPRSGASRGASGPGGRGATRAAVPAATGSSLFLRLVATVSLVVAAVACAWAWQLEERLTQTGFQLERYEERIGELEARLSDTDEGLSQNTAAMAVKIKELYSEVDKLWASAWRRNKARLDEIEGANSNQGESIAALKKDVAAASGQLKTASSDIARLKGVAGDLERLMGNAKANQAQVERVADTLNRLDLEMNRLAKRVEANEGWVESINAFRRQVNASISQLEGTVRTLQQGTAAGGAGG